MRKVRSDANVIPRLELLHQQLVTLPHFSKARPLAPFHPPILPFPLPPPPPTSLAGRREEGECREGLPSSRCSSGARAAPPEAKAQWRTFQRRAVLECNAAEHSEASPTQTPEAAPAPSPSQGRVSGTGSSTQQASAVLLSHSLLHLPFRPMLASTIRYSSFTSLLLHYSHLRYCRRSRYILLQALQKLEAEEV